MPADYLRLSRLLDLSAGNRIITDVGSAATDFEADGGLILAADLDIRGGDIQSTTGALTVTTGSGNLIFNPAGIITTSKAVHGIDGTASAPAVTFTSDTDTGLYRSEANALDVSLGGTRRLGYSAGAFQFKENTTISSTGTLTLTTPIIASFAEANHDHSNDAGGANISIISGTSGTLTVARGGTGATSLTDGGVLLGSGAGAITAMAVLADGAMIVGDGTTAPVAESGDTLRQSIGVGSTSTWQITGLNIGAASDTTLTRVSAGDLQIESNIIYRAGGTDVAVADGGTGASSLNDLITLTTHTTGNYVSTVAAGTGLTSTGATSGEGIAHSLSVDASQAQITTVGDLDAGSITANFGSINNGSSAITTTGTVTTGPIVIVGDISTTAAQDWDLLDNNASALSFDATGKAGILALVTTDSSEGVTMSGTLNVTGLATLASVDINAGAIDNVTIGTTTAVSDLRVGNLKLITNTISSTNSNGNVIIDPIGAGIVNLNANVGIGTTSVDGLLHLDNGTSNTYMVLEKDADTATGFLFHEAGSQKASIVYGADQHLLIKHEESNMDIIFNVNDGGSNTEVMRIDGDVSRVGIGTASPSGKLQVEDATTVSAIVKSSNAATSSIVETQNDQGANSFGRMETFGSSASSNHLGVTKANRTFIYAGGSSSTGLSLGTATDDTITISQNSVQAFIIDTSKNFGFNTATFGTNAAKVFGIGSGGAPVSSPADMIQLWAEDVASGDSRLHIRTESGSGNNIIVGNGEIRTASGGLTLTANNGSSAITLTGSISGSAVKDEDNMSSNSATHIATQQSIKAYVDAQILTIDSMDELTDTTITSPADASLLIYDTGTSRWRNQGITGDISVSDTGVVAITGGAIVNADVNASAAIVDTKLATIATANKVSLSALNIDGGTDIGAVLADADLLIVDDAGGGTNRKTAVTRIPVYTFGKITGDVTINSSGVAAITGGVVVNADINASAAIVDTKLATIATANKVSGSAVQLASTSALENSTGLRIKAATAGAGLGISSQVLAVNVDDSSIEINSDTLRVKATGVTNAMLAGSIANDKLANSTITMAASAGSSDAIALGETFTITAGEGIDTTMGTNLVTIAGEDATTSNKGVASFSGDNFAVSSGAVTIKDGGVNNAELANSSITVSDGSNTSPVALGGTLTFAATANETTVAESNGTVTIGLPNDVVITGDLTVNGTSTNVNSSTVTIDDPLFALADNNSADTVDIGWYGKYVDSGTKYTGFFRDASDSDKWKLFATTGNSHAAPTTTVNTTSGFTLGVLVAATFEGALVGNSDTATILATARNIGGVSFNGSADIVPTTIVVTDTTDTSAYVALFDSATGNLLPKTDAGITYNAGTGMLTATGLTGPLTGNADTATALATGRTIGMTGDVVWTSASFTGAGNVTGVATIQANSIDSDSYIDASIDFEHIQNVAANSILGRNANSSGVLSEIALATTQILIGDGTGFTAAALSGDVTMTNGGAVTIANSAVTLAKMANLANLRVIGNVSGSTAAPAAVTILDEDNMSTNSATALATQQSIKYYVDNETTSTIADATDTTITSPADGALLLYDTSTSKWIDNLVSGDATVADTGALTIANSAVTLAKMANLATMKVIGRVTGSTGVPEAVSLLDENDMASNSDTALATQQSIKYYVDNNTTSSISAATDTDISSASAGHVLVYDGSNSWDNKAISGDATLSSAGALTIASAAIETAMVNNNVITGQAEITSGVVGSADFLLLFDTDANTYKKVKPDNLGVSTPPAGSASEIQYRSSSTAFGAAANVEIRNNSLALKEQSSSSAAVSGFGMLYARNDNHLYYRQDNGSEERLTGAATANFAAVKAYLNADLTVATATATTLGTGSAGTWTEVFDVGTFHDASSNTDRFTFDITGYYLVTLSQQWASNAVGYREIKAVYRDDSGSSDSDILVDKLSNLGYTDPYSSSSTVVYVDDTSDYLTVQAYQTSGGDLTLEAGADETTSITIVKLDSAPNGVSASTARGRLTTATTAISHNSETAVPMNADVHDTHGYHDPATNNHRFVVPTTGYYHVQSKITMDGAAGDANYYIRLRIKDDTGAEIAEGWNSQGTSATTYATVETSATVYLEANQWVAAYVTQTRDANTNLIGGDAELTTFNIYRLDAQNGDASGVSGAVQLSAGNGGFLSDASNLFWDDSNNRLGIGTNTPTTTLQVNGVATFESYVDFNLISAPSNPATEDARMYLKQVDSNNNAIAVKLQKAGSIVEVEITSPGAICVECGSEDGTRDPIYDFKKEKMVLNLFCGHSYEVDMPQWRRLK